MARRGLPRRSRGLLLPPQLRRHGAVAPRRRPRARRRGHVQPGAGHDRPAQHHRPVPALRGRRPALEPGRPVAPGARLRHRTGEARPAAGAVPRRRRHAGPPPPPRPPRERRSPSSCSVRTTADGAVVGETEHPLAAGTNEIEWSLDIDRPAAVVAAGARRPAADRRSTSSCSSTARSATAAPGGPGCARWRGTTGSARSTASGCSSRPPTSCRPGPGSPTPRRPTVRRDVELAVEAGLDALRVQAHIADHELYRAADELGVLLLQDFPLQWGYARQIRREAVRQAREAVNALGHHPSIVQWCAHDEPIADAPQVEADSRVAPAAPVRRPAAADVEQDRARPVGQAGVRAGRPDPPDGRPRRRHPAPAAARRHRHPPVARLAPRRGRRAGRRGPGRSPRSCASSASSARSPCPTRPSRSST